MPERPEAGVNVHEGNTYSTFKFGFIRSSISSWLRLRRLRVKASQGSAEDAARLGDHYYEESLDQLLGDGPKARPLALKWYRKAAELGDRHLKSQQSRLEKIKVKEPSRKAYDELTCYAAERGHYHALWELMYDDYIYHHKYTVAEIGHMQTVTAKS